MSHIDHYNAMRGMMDIMRDSHTRLIERMCIELGCPDRIDEFTGKFIDETIKLKKFKDVNAPKNAKTSYMFFCAERRAELKKKDKDLTFAQIMSILSKEWNALKEDGRVKYAVMATEDKERYQTELEAYKAKLYSSTVSD